MVSQPSYFHCKIPGGPVTMESTAELLNTEQSVSKALLEVNEGRFLFIRALQTSVSKICKIYCHESVVSVHCPRISLLLVLHPATYLVIYRKI